MIRLPFSIVLVFLGIVWVKALDQDDTEEHWETFKLKYNKTYDSTEVEQQKRENFEKNVLHVALHNLKDEHDYEKDVHEFSDMTVKEQIDALCRTRLPDDYVETNPIDYSTSVRNLPVSVDWVEKGRVMPVLNQGSCGSCWAYTAAQALEGQISKDPNQRVELSKQQLLDCAGSYGNYGCDGGWPNSAFRYIRDNGGLVEERSYPYRNKVGSCNINKDAKRYTIRGTRSVTPSGDETAVAKALAENGPLSCALYVSDDFMQYRRGIFSDRKYTNQDVNHGVLLVGFGTENGKDFWKIKNSWGTSWGEKGYMRIARNSNNMVKVASYTSFPIV